MAWTIENSSRTTPSMVAMCAPVFARNGHHRDRLPARPGPAGTQRRRQPADSDGATSTATFLEDGDTVVFACWCERPGASDRFCEARDRVLPATTRGPL